MVKKKTKASVIVQFRWKEEFLEMVKNDALKNGVPLGSYLAMLASQKHIENEAMIQYAHIAKILNSTI